MRRQSSFITRVAVSVVALGVCLVSAAGAQVPSSVDPMTILALQTEIGPGTDRQVVPLFKGPRRTVVQITLRNGTTLEAHKAPVPITIQCVAGSGTLSVAGQPALALKPGVLVTLEPDVVHEIVAAPAVSILLTQFTDR